MERKENYAAARGLTNAGWTFTIAKATPPASVTKPLNSANHLKRTYTFALSNLRPAIVGGWGEVSYEFTASFTKPGYYTSGAEITPGPSGVPNTLTLPIQFNDTTDEGKVGTVTVTLHSQNYGDYTGTINIVASNKTVVTFSGVEGVTTPYTGQSVEGYKGTLAVTTQNDEAVNVNDLTLEISYTGRLDTSYESTQPPTDVGTYFVVFRAADTDEHYIGREHFAFEITKAAPTGAPKYTAITTSGKTLADAALTTAGGTFSVPGTVAWELDETTAVEANTAYKWIFTTTDTHNYTTLEGSVTLWQRSSGGNTGGNSGGSYTPTYPPTVPKPSEGGGTPTVTPSNPKPGDTVTVTPKPDEGYEVDKITVTDKNGKPVEVTKKPDGTYTFKQPSGKVTIEVTYQPIDRPWNNPFTDVSEHDRQLLTGDGVIGAECAVSVAAHDTLACRPADGLGVPRLVRHIGEVQQVIHSRSALFVEQDLSKLGAGEGVVRPKPAIAVAIHQAPLLDKPYRFIVPIALWRYVGSPAATNKELHFNDTDEISPFALEALRWAVENGILNGYGDGRLGPQGQATRAQVAQMLKNFIENQEKNT